MSVEKDKPMTAYLTEKYKHETLRKTNNELLHQLTKAMRLVGGKNALWSVAFTPRTILLLAWSLPLFSRTNRHIVLV